MSSTKKETTQHRTPNQPLLSPPAAGKATALEELLWSLRMLSRESVMFNTAAAEHLGLNVTDGECIDYLLENGPVTAGNLAKITGLTNGAITSVIDRLEKAGYVQRTADPADRRVVLVTLVPEKLKVSFAFYQTHVQTIKALFQPYGEDELKLLAHATSQLAEIYKEETHSIRQNKKDAASKRKPD